MDRGPIGAIQNLGVVPEYRGQGLGRALVRQALEGFYQAGLRRAYLEVTAENSAAVRLYRTSASAGPRRCTRPSTADAGGRSAGRVPVRCLLSR